MINDIYIYCLATERDSAMPMIIVEPEMKASMNDQMLCSALSNLWLGYTHIFFFLFSRLAWSDGPTCIKRIPSFPKAKPLWTENLKQNIHIPDFQGN